MIMGCWQRQDSDPDWIKSGSAQTWSPWHLVEETLMGFGTGLERLMGFRRGS